ncbi:SGNH/GDSL hydrolase family protein [Parapedobacter sp. SGR-10]|uniref:SGNH/GDSL hydrolase family protein n=1 Tax=Parapedobacter sp. SGR-10 TaxID=2710879 RepID=UPI0013D63B7A|nr:SGNH/GDSL hydrolase family protein [Parapedobacter sp. SGR-10]NGF54920.1 SGNH/GDSL hydrolase family protein [Parapedobacter sp. SGR-10]
MSNRRVFLKQSALSVGATLIGSSLLRAEDLSSKNSKITINSNDIILFQGDSITDAGRKKDTSTPNDIAAMGRGYAMIAASVLLNKYADKNLQIYNRGISGHKVPQLDDRWQADCLDIKPNILSILIGVNDYWHKRNGKYEGTAKIYGDQYRKLLDKTLTALPQVKLIIGEPFAVKNVKHVDDSWFPEFAEYQKVARDIAKEYKALFIPYQSIFDAAEKRNSGAYWTTDGVHTSLAGANLMAESWLECVK